MAPGSEADGLLLERTIELIGRIRTSLTGIDEVAFLADRDKLDLTAFRLSQIGELTNKLSADLKRGRPEIPWRSIYGLRNIIAHHYEASNPEIIWEVASASLDALEAVCREELARLDR